MVSIKRFLREEKRMLSFRILSLGLMMIRFIHSFRNITIPFHTTVVKQETMNSSTEAGADGNYGAKMEYLRRMEDLVETFFDLVDDIEEMNRYCEALDQEYEERVKNGTENDPGFQERWNADDSRRRSAVSFIKFNDANVVVVLASSFDAAMENIPLIRTDFQHILCMDSESAMRAIRDQMNLGAQLTCLNPAAASA